MDSPGLDLIFGLVGIILFNYRNPDKKGLVIISVFLAGLFISQILYLTIGNLTGIIVYIISSLGLLITYIDRFNNKPEKRVIELLKMGGILLLIIYPFPFYDLLSIGRYNFLAVTRELTFYILITIYVYDRWVLKPEMMKKKFIIVLVVQSLAILLMLTFSIMQRAKADESTQRAFELSMEVNAEKMRALEIEKKYNELLEKENTR